MQITDHPGAAACPGKDEVRTVADRPRRWKLTDQRIRVKFLWTFTPLAAAILVLAGGLEISMAAGSSQADRAHTLVELGTAAANVTAGLQRERTAAALLLIGGGDTDAYRDRITATDTSVGAWRRRARVADSAALRDRMTRIDGELTDLLVLRQQVQANPVTVGSGVLFRYRALIADLIGVRQAVTQTPGVSTAAANELRATTALTESVEALALAQATTVRVLAAGVLYPAAQQEILGADAAYTQATRTFVELAPNGWLGLRNTVVAGAKVAGAERLYGIATRTQPGTTPDLGVDAAGWVAATTIRMDLLHQVEASLDQRVLDRVAAERDTTRRQMTGLGVGVLAGVLVMLAWVWWVARSMVGSLTRLRHGAETVAGDLLPDLVRRLGQATGPTPEVDTLITATLAPLSIPGSDEVGQVAAAFTEVTDRAARMAADQARMRSDIRAIFMSLANRLQRRIGPVLAALEDAQRDEADAQRLAQLFAVDHQVTLVRRIIAGLQIQAGGRAGRTRPRPMALPDVVRAAYGQIAHYERVNTPKVDPDVFVAGDVVEDLTYLLAELMDNATRFSPDDTQVTVQAHQVTDAVYIGITDAGSGMSPQTLAEARAVLARPGVLDRRTAEQMGLPVAAAIARHLGITIELESSRGCGTRVTVILPKTLLTPAPAPTPASAEVEVEASSTAVLPQVPTTPPVAALSAPPPSWPLPAAAPVEPVHPVIFEEVSSWFHPQQGVPTVLAEPHWQRAAQVFAQQQAPARTTVGGLPVRQPGALVIEAVTTPNRLRRPQPAADTNATSRRIASLHDGLRAAGLKTPYVRVSREER